MGLEMESNMRPLLMPVRSAETVARHAWVVSLCLMIGTSVLLVTAYRFVQSKKKKGQVRFFLAGRLISRVSLLRARHQLPLDRQTIARTVAVMPALLQMTLTQAAQEVGCVAALGHQFDQPQARRLAPGVPGVAR
jgi:hypothetical protein